MTIPTKIINFSFHTTNENNLVILSEDISDQRTLQFEFTNSISGYNLKI